MTVFKLDWKRGFGGMISWSIVFSAVIVILMFLHSMAGGMFNPETFGSKVESMPGIVSGILGLHGVTDLSHPYYFAAYLFQFILLFSGIYACIMGARALTYEESHGTIEFLYGLPISRSSIFGQKVICAFVRYFIYSLVLFVVTCLIIWFLHREMSISGVFIDMIRVFICQIIIGFVYISIGILISALFRSNAESISVALAIVLITYIIGMMGNIMDHLAFLCFISPVHAILPLGTLLYGFNILGLAVCALLIVLCLLLASIRYKKKDFLV
ncbi:MAG: ABC transporter permease subunit [Firmicutes bacterium]|nr:ABC transporter permease subunit [Bacillota bacterium]MBQ6810036.1 ABC transporter permease subunit [Bacillota bacterium]